MWKPVVAFVVLASSQSLHAQKTKTEFAAPNGVVVTVNTDEFAGRREYSSPLVKFTPDGGGFGAAMVGEVFNAGKLNGLIVQGVVAYSGDWRFYDSAIFKGGAPANFHRSGSNVGSCRYGCTLNEDFVIELTAEDAKAHGENGVVAIQIRGERGATAIISIPLTYFDAVQAIAR